VTPEATPKERYILKDRPRCGVYFVRHGEFIKIGCSSDVRHRLSILQQGFPTALEPLGFIRVEMFDSEHVLENQLHRQFSRLRHHGEWFRDDPELRAFIATEVGQWPV
jgi:Meiotically Up-regulated Gene 113 (MUG113) protein